MLPGLSFPLRPKIRGYLDLVRLPNLFTAMADVLAGFFFAGGMVSEWFLVLRLLAASVSLYAGGVALNDVCDAEVDALERPTRPIPSGQISRSRALRVSAVLMGTGLAFSATVSAQALMVALALCISILLYNILLKSTVFAPPLMGICRAMNLLLGMHGLTTLAPLGGVRPMVVMWVYVSSVTFFARREARSGGRFRLLLGTLGVATAVLGLWWVFGSGYNARYGEYRYLAGLMLAGVCFVGLYVLVRPDAHRIQAAVRAFVLGIIVLDACLAWVAAGPLAAVIIGTMLVPSIVTARSLRVT